MTTPFSTGLRLHAKIPQVQHWNNSEAHMVREEISARLVASNFFSGYTHAGNTAFSVQPESLPFCGVYLLEERMIPDGDANAGEVRFHSVARIGISVIVANNDAVVAERKLDAAYQYIMHTLLRDNRFYDNINFSIQSFPVCNRMHVFGNLGKDQETPSAELRIELSCDLGTIIYEALTPDVLETIRVETLPSIGDEKTTRIISVYDIDQGS